MSRTLYVLRHRPGPALAGEQSVFDHPGIADHLAFLRRRIDDGSLVAAGPLEQRSGEGMTVLAVASLDEARRLAETDDGSVVAGVLAVEVQVWQVVMDNGLLPEPGPVA
jgi:uncharacterized protein YciI